MTRVADSYRIEPLTNDRWDDVAALFAEGGDPKTCWCMYWRVGGREWSMLSAGSNRARFGQLVDEGPAPGLLLYEDDRAVGWVSLGPREAFERLEHSRVRARIDDQPVWSIVCFVVSRSARRKGIAHRLLEAAVEYAREHGAPALEAYPVDPGDGRVGAAPAYTGLLSMFEPAGFEVVRQIESPGAKVRRVIVRRSLR